MQQTAVSGSDILIHAHDFLNDLLRLYRVCGIVDLMSPFVCRNEITTFLNLPAGLIHPGYSPHLQNCCSGEAEESLFFFNSFIFCLARASIQLLPLNSRSE